MSAHTQQSFDFLDVLDQSAEQAAESTLAPMVEILPSSKDELPTPYIAAQKPLRIAILGYRSHPFSGGQGIYIKYLSKALVEAGHQVDVISGEPYPHLDERVGLIKMPGMNLYEHGLASLRLHHLRSYANIVEWCSKLTGGFAEPYAFGRRINAYLKTHGNDYDLIHDNQSLSYGLLAIQKRLPLVATIHHPITSDLQIALNASNKWLERLFIRRWYAFVAMQSYVVKHLKHAVTVSECSRGDIAKAFGINAAQLQLIHCGIDTEEFVPRAHIQRKTQRIMATASADQPLKGLAFLLQAYADLLVEFPDLELLIVGKPSVGGATDKLLKQLNIDTRVQFVSGISTEQLIDYYAEATIAVVPSVYEGFGLPAGEAMSCEVPLISTTGGALPEVVGDAGILVPIENAQAIAAAIKELLNDTEKREHLGKAGRVRIVEMFSWNKAAKVFTQFYHQVIKEYANR